jgi:C_GCAxxG_C_C family probable redox protein
MQMPSVESILDAFTHGQECAQVTLAPLACRLGLTRRQAQRLTACFGGGMGCQGPCGAVSAALMALGLAYGHDGPNQFARKQALLDRRQALLAEVQSAFGSVCCDGILASHPYAGPGYNPVCAQVVRHVLALLDAELAPEAMLP